ncbi:MAG: transcriptional regulator, Crp family protein [Tardiphaga sp.]|jgi:CRP-like cAMP-binding protein|nr:transcriptional regulator, Crp family protein [Tardiphaga sp.]
MFMKTDFSRGKASEMIAGLPSTRLITRLQCVTDISAATERLIALLPIAVRNYAANEIIVAQGAKSTNCCLVLDGFVAREKAANTSDRQIISFYVPGDIPDASTLHLPKMDHNLIGIGPAVVGFIPHLSVNEALAQSPELLHAFWRETLIDSALLRQWVVNLGQREGIARVAHLLCELAMRLDAVGLLRDRSLPIPWTQVDVADATGMSAIHANRVIQDLRTRGVVHWESRYVRIVDWQQLRDVAGFAPDYLHLKRPGTSLTAPSALV